MKIGILTYYNVHNHGAVLQAYALKTILSSYGYECVFLKFERDYSMISSKQAIKYQISLKSIPFYFKYLCEKGIGNIFYNIKKNKVLNIFRNYYLPTGDRYNLFKGDTVVIGSDEVFSLEIGINPFFYGNGLNVKNVISYAGSFGPTTLADVKTCHQEDMLISGFKNMKAVSVRDFNSQHIVENIVGKDAELVCDPVILYGYKREMKEYIPPIKDYIVIYAYDKNMNSKDEVEKIEQYAKENNLQIVSVAYYHKWCHNIQANPIELLGWIRNAKLVITDTFHGTVLSIICNAQMIVKLRGNKNKLEFLLEEYQLNDRIVDDFLQMTKVASKKIDFLSVNTLIEEKRRKSSNFLKSALENCENV